MSDFSAFGLLGLCIGFLWGIGCSLAILYSIYLGGYRRAVKDSLATEKPRRYQDVLKKIEAKRARKAVSEARDTPAAP